ncbi:hypothetical protein FO519_009885 [Halicephalobus sp. NKZ332]|nr:hypothetical protein FO519_009885 [Halicephalobus sp. NKZ332]
MMLKVLTLKADLQAAEYVIISSDTEQSDHIIARGSTFYQGQNFTITYSKTPLVGDLNYGVALFVSTIEFGPYVNSVCLSTMSSNLDGNTTSISNLDIENGYKVNSGCSSKIPEKENHITTLLIDTYFYERYGDMLTISFGQNVYMGLITYDEIVVEDVGDIEINFSSDGSVVGAGFEIIQKYVSCTCGPSVVKVPCNGSVYLTVTETINSYSYCSNMNCSFSIVREETCSDLQLNLEASVTLRMFSNDSLIIKVNGEPSESFTGSIHSNKTMDFTSDAKVEIDFISRNTNAKFYPAPYVMLRVFIGAGDNDQGSPTPSPENFTSSTESSSLSPENFASSTESSSLSTESSSFSPESSSLSSESSTSPNSGSNLSPGLSSILLVFSIILLIEKV